MATRKPIEQDTGERAGQGAQERAEDEGVEGLAAPTVAPIVEKWHDGGFIVSVANGHRSFDQVGLTGGKKIYAGTVLTLLYPSMKYAPATEGSTVASAILFATKDVTTSDKPATVLARDAEVNGTELIWDPSFDAAGIQNAIAQLATIGIIVR